MVDTSGSINTPQVTQAYSEIKGAIEQFNSLSGFLGFFDEKVYEPVEFNSVEDILSIIPKGGVGTNFYKIFEYVIKMDVKPKAIIILKYFSKKFITR
jgi:predicted metal-dependent peptidase